MSSRVARAARAAPADRWPEPSPGRALALALALAAALAVPAGRAAEPAEVASFARSLYAEGEYYRAVTECKRFLHLWPAAPERSLILGLEGRSLFFDQRYEEAARLFAGMAAGAPGPEGHGAAGLWAGLAWLRAGRPERAEPILLDLAAGGRPPAEAARARYELIWEALRAGRLDRALELAGPAGDGPGSGLELAARGLGEEVVRAQPLPHRSPWLAGSLAAALPGAGHLYLGRPAEALTSLLLNGLFVWAAADAFANDQDGLGVLLGTVEVGWYAGGIWSAARGAERFNAARREELAARVAVSWPTPEELDELARLEPP